MTDMNNRSMNDNNENRNNDPKERMRKKVKKAAGIALCAVLAGGLAAGSFEGVNALTGWNSSSVEAASSNKENTTLLQTRRINPTAVMKAIPARQKEAWMYLISQQKE